RLLLGQAAVVGRGQLRPGAVLDRDRSADAPGAEPDRRHLQAGPLAQQAVLHAVPPPSPEYVVPRIVQFRTRPKAPFWHQTCCESGPAEALDRAVSDRRIAKE